MNSPGKLSYLERAALLRQAAALVKQVDADMQIAGKACACCDAMRFDHLNEVVEHRKLTGMAEKLETLARRQLGRQQEEEQTDDEAFKHRWDVDRRHAVCLEEVPS